MNDFPTAPDLVPIGTSYLQAALQFKDEGSQGCLGSDPSSGSFFTGCAPEMSYLTSLCLGCPECTR